MLFSTVYLLFLANIYAAICTEEICFSSQTLVNENKKECKKADVYYPTVNDVETCKYTLAQQGFE